MKFSRIVVGDVLLDVHSYKTNVGPLLGCWKVEVISMDSVTETAMFSWNGNPPRMYTRRQLERLHATPPKRYRDQQDRLYGRSPGCGS